MIHLICPNPAIDRTLLFEKIVRDKPNRPLKMKEVPGGKGFNVAYALSFDHDVDFKIHTILGGKYGEHFIQLADYYHYPIVRTAADTNTRLCHILVDESDRSLILSQEYGFKLNRRLFNSFTNTLLDSVKNGDYIVFSGSLMQGMPETYISDVDEQLQQRGVKARMVIDTSGAPLRQAYKLAPYMIKINNEEILDIFPQKKLETIQDYLHLLQSDVDPAISNFIITLGGKGAIGRIGHKYLYGYSQPVEVKNPNASGDFFLGRFMHGLARKEEETTILREALAFSTSNVENWFPEVTPKQLANAKIEIQDLELGAKIK